MNISCGKYGLPIKNLPDAITYNQIVYDDHGRPSSCIIRDVNAAFEKMMGLSRDETIGRRTADSHPEIKDMGLDWMECYKQASIEGEVHFEIYIESTKRYYHVAVFLEKTGYFFTLFQDMTLQKKKAGDTQAALFSFLEKSLNTTLVWISTLDKEGNIVLWNKGAERISGYTAEEVVGDASIWGKLYPDPGYCKKFLDIIMETIYKGKPLTQLETPLQRKDGSHRTMIWNANPLQVSGVIAGSMVFGADITREKEVQKALEKNQEHMQLKLNRFLSEGDTGKITLENIIDIEEVQLLMEHFYQLTQIGVAIIGKNGEILVKTGWQDICTKFHRVHPKTNQHCRESDLELSKRVRPNTYKMYKCKNNMWDIVTPITVGQKHLGNLFLGQFFFQDEEVNYEVFQAQARRYGFDEQEYLKALDEVPRWSREKVRTAMDFYTKLANMISLLSYSNTRLAHLLVERDTTIHKLQRAEKKLEEYSKKMEQLYQQQDREMERARQLHERILPTSLPYMEKISFATYYQPARKLGGDFYDVIQVGKRLILYLSDVSGHGIDSAMLSLFIKHTIKSFFTLVPPAAITPKKILQYLSTKFREENYPNEYFICIFLGVLNLETMDLQYSGAGFQDQPLVLMGDGDMQELLCKGLFITPLFPEKQLLFTQNSIHLTPGTTLFLNTDGLTEQGTLGDYYRDRLPIVFYQNARRPPTLIKKAVVEDFRHFNNGSVQGKDDITFLVLQVHSENLPPQIGTRKELVVKPSFPPFHNPLQDSCSSISTASLPPLPSQKGQKNSSSYR